MEAIHCLQDKFDWQIGVIDTYNDPSAIAPVPNNGDRFLIGTSPVGPWAGLANHIAILTNNSWTIYTPEDGWYCRVKNKNKLYLYDINKWVPALVSFEHTDAYTIGGENAPYFDTKRTSYQVVRRFQFKGTTKAGVPKSIDVVGFTDNAAVAMEWQVYDVTNAAIIANGSIVATGPTTSIASTLTNLPASEATFEVWLRRATGTTTSVYISYVGVNF